MAVTAFHSPKGMVESTGRVALDAGKVLRHPGFRYWSTTVNLAVRLVRDAAPMALLLCFFVGSFVVIQGAFILGRFGVDRGLAGMIISSLGLREMCMLMGASAIGASAGAGWVTELGAMRVSEEIDALEVMGLHSYPYLVSTRVMAAVMAGIPIFAGSIAAMFLGSFMSASLQISGLNMGSFSSFFWAGIAPIDIFYTLVKGSIACAMVALVCSSGGYRARGGPIGVGMAVGESLNLTLVLVMFVNLFLSYLFWGISNTVKI